MAAPTHLSLSLFLLAAASLNAEIRDVRANRPFFDPTFGQKISVSFTSTLAGTATVEVRDRDGFLIRALGKQPVKKGASVTFSWDGRDDKGRIVVSSDRKGERVALGKLSGALELRPFPIA